ncbi:DUF1749 domain-containing protein, partial [Candidatus Micrarchaeota archaeon]|nr:DUF1749 domain-containing protein [Candidatus Micrarchaeota archaeon]
FIGRNGTKRVFLCGHSTGSQKVTFYQEKTADRRVKGLILLSPADDLNAWKKELGRKFNDTIALARKLYHKDKMAFVPIKILGELRGAQRFFNLADERYAEGRIFNYARPKLTEFGKVRVPVLVVWGQKEEYLPSSIKECNQLLTKSSHSRNLQIKVMRGAGHSFKRHEKELAGIVNGWLTKL